MAAEIVEEVQEELVLQEGETEGNIVEETLVDVPEPEETVEVEEPEEEVPEQYRGKSQVELAKMLQDAQQEIGHKGNELGALRKSLNSSPHSNPQRRNQSRNPQTMWITLSTRRQRSTDRLITIRHYGRPSKLCSRCSTHRAATLQQRHPDVKDVVASEDFRKWVSESPARVSRYQKADQLGDVDEADDLISTFKQIRQAGTAAKEVATKAQKQAVRSASVGASQGAATDGGSRRIYRRADIRQLMRTDPDRYEALQPEIMKAYAEGRVKISQR